MRKALFILGPTGVGKTDLGLSLATKFSGNILSVDSVQVYKGLDIISGKDLPFGTSFDISKRISGINKNYIVGAYNFGTIPVFLLDIVLPSYDFSVYDFLKCALPVSRYIDSQNKLPIFVGGTGFYVKALLDGIKTSSIPKDLDFRNNFSKHSRPKLQEFLEKEDRKKFSSMNASDRNNPRRLIRAIEVARFLKTKKKDAIEMEKLNTDTLLIGLFCDRENLKKRIEIRVKKRIEMGAVEEAEGLFKNYEKLSPQVKNAAGYKQLFDFLSGKISWDEAIEKWKISESQLSKNQMTWFGKDKRVKWFDVSDKLFVENAVREVNNWYNKGV